MHSLGERLRRERESRNLSIDELAQQTKIAGRYLRAIEGNQLDELPASFFRRAFIRQYHLALGLEADGLDAELDQLIGPVETMREEQPLPDPPAPIKVEALPIPGKSGVSPRRMAYASGLLIFAIGSCAAVYALYQRTQASTPMDARTPFPSARVAAVENPDPVSQPPITEPAAVPAAEPEDAAAQAPVTTDPAPVTAPATTETAEPMPGKLTLDVSAKEDTWVRLSADGKTLFTGILKASEVKTFPNVPTSKLMVGNAGGIDVKWNGKWIGEIGPRGQVRTVEFTPESYLILSPAPKT